jgi:hypothetical protein
MSAPATPAPFNPDDLPAARAYVRLLARFYCGGTHGRGKLDPVYVHVTQGRDFKANWHAYSSCGDLLHCLAWELGARSLWVNRDADASPDGSAVQWPARKWSFGQRDNISMLQGPNGPSIPTPLSYVPESGDFLMCWHDDGSGVHVRVAGNTDAGLLETFDYGAGGCSPTEFPGATCNPVTLVTNGGQLLLESPATHARKRVQRVVPLARLLLESTAPTIAVEASTLTLP